MKQRILFNFTGETAGKPIIATIIRTFDVEINVLNAKINSDGYGQMLVEAQGEAAAIDEMIGYTETQGVGALKVVSVVTVDKDQCVNCGACTAACAVGALYMDENWRLVHDVEKCVECTLCVVGCPARAIYTFK